MKNTVSILAAACLAFAAAPAFSEGMANDAMAKDKMGKQDGMAKHKAKPKKKMDRMEKDGAMAKDKMGK